MTTDRWRQIELLYHATLEHAAGERAAFLRDACPNDDSLRREVESLLAQEDGTDNLLETPVLEAAAKMFAQPQGVSLIGRQIGHYRVLSLLGAGGMGEVYKARDTRLDRIVAIKVLPHHLAERNEVRERFDREAKTIGGLNHPHICVLHDIGHQDGTDFLVMEYLEGETVAARLQKGPLPLDQALQYAIEIADALDKAHRKGITHRDLKPDNIMLTKNGTKLLDFGLAKLKPATVAGVPLSLLPTVSHNPTVEGAILGTLQYMAPEQVEGKNEQIDARTDIFAFGAVVYEMVTGKKSFEGATSASLIASILERDPPPMTLPHAMTPPPLDRVIRKCLAKDPEKRWQAVSDVCDELKWIAEGGSQSGVSAAAQAAPAHGSKSKSWIVWASISAILVAGLIAGAAYLFRSAPLSNANVQFAVYPPEKGQFLENPCFMSLSPDGTKLAFAASNSSGQQQLWIRSLDSATAQPIAGTDNAACPFWSPDSRFVGFSNGSVKTVALSNGAVQTVYENVGETLEGTWSRDGIIVLGRRGAGVRDGATLFRVSADGGEVKPFTLLDTARGETLHASPCFLPDGKHLLFYVYAGAGSANNGIYVGSLDSKEKKLILKVDSNVAYVPGYLIFTRQNTLLAQPFDLSKLDVFGEAIPIAGGVNTAGSIAPTAAFSASQTGLLAFHFTSGSTRSLVWLNRDGAEESIGVPPRNYQQPRLSPNGRQVAVEVDQQVWTYDLSRKTLTRLTFDGMANDIPIWTPDGKHVAYRARTSRGVSLVWQLSDGTGDKDEFATGPGYTPSSWSPDGQTFAFTENDPINGRNILMWSATDRKVRPLLATQFSEGAPEFSPDGRWFAYTSNESGRFEVYVQSFPGPGGKWQISTEGGAEPHWNPNGGEVFYRNGTKMMAVHVTRQSNFSAGTPTMLFDKPYVATPLPLTFQYYDVSRDGQRFLMVKQLNQAEQPITVELNWTQQIKRRVPAGTN